MNETNFLSIETAPNWFLVELRESEDEEESFLEADETDSRDTFLFSALPLLGDVELSFWQLSENELLIHITCPDAFIDIRVKPPQMTIMVQVIGDARAPIRFCENLDAYVWGTQGVQLLPKGSLSTSEIRPSGTVFGRVLTQDQSEYQTLTLADHPVYGRAFLLDGSVQLGAADERLYSDTLVSHAIFEKACSVLILGGGDCGVLREVLRRDVKRVVMVELDPAVLDFCKEHFPDVVKDAPQDPRAQIRFGDAFVFLEQCEEQFDVVISDLLDEPISNLSLDDQVKLMKRVVTEDGRLVTHLEFVEFEDRTYGSEPMVEAFGNHLDDIEVVEQRIPSFQDQLWLFVRGTKHDKERSHE